MVGDAFDAESHGLEMISALHLFLRLREHPVDEIPVTEDTFIRLPEKIPTVHRQDVRPTSPLLRMRPPSTRSSRRPAPAPSSTKRRYPVLARDVSSAKWRSTSFTSCHEFARLPRTGP